MTSSTDSWDPWSSSRDDTQLAAEERRESDASISLQSATSTAPSVDNTQASIFMPRFSVIPEPHTQDVSEHNNVFPTSSEALKDEQHPDAMDMNKEVRSKLYTEAYTHGYTEGYIVRDAKPRETTPMPIAIVGMSCRLPGNVTTPDEFWELCSRARSGWSEIPHARFNATSYYHPNPGKGGCFNPTGGSFLKEDISLFDAPFFNLTAQEATAMDPQQRILLECTFEALDSAGIPKHSIAGKDVGVFVGGSFSEYEAQSFKDVDTIPMYQATGCAFAMQSNRLSHFFDLKGPSLTLDTACSSSMVALHQACQSIRTGESKMAIVAGCHLNMLPEFWVSFSMSRLFSNEGRSFAFDSRGTGYGRGEGCGVIILKSLDQALKDNDVVRSVIVNTGINQDGFTPGITMPNGTAQEDLMKSVYKQAGISPKDTGYVEAHGTGTKVGDPIEAQALYNVFGEDRSARNPLFIGSVKSNIGHLEAASGIVSIIKTALMLERGFILPNYDFKKPHEKIPMAKWNLKVPISQRPWPRKRFASVNNFGFGGTNAHAVLERGPFVKKYDGLEPEYTSVRPRRLFVLSANDKIALEALMKNVGIYLEQRPEVFQNDLMSNVAYTLGQRRSLMQWRVAISTKSSFNLIQDLNSGKVPLAKEIERPRIGFIFTGQGAQWHAMGRELHSNYPVYAATIEACDRHLASLGAPFSLIDELNKDATTTSINEAHISQPACTAIQLALTDLLRDWGVSPSAVAGHSSGEIGAAYAAGILPLEACMSISYHRGMVTLELKRNYPELKGSMMAVGCTKEELVPLIADLKHKEVRIACFNSPSSLTISGDEPAIDELQIVLERKALFARKLQVSMAYHSHHMELVAKDYREALQSLVSPVCTSIKFHSSLLGHLVDGDTLEPSYWVQNLTRAVRFSEALTSMCHLDNDHKTGVNMILEIGPHSALDGPCKQILKSIGANALKIHYSSALVRKRDAVETMFEVASNVFRKGGTLNLSAINFPNFCKPPTLLVDMPRYPWNHNTKYWHEPRVAKAPKTRVAPRNGLLGSLAAYSNELEPTWRNVLRVDDLPWLRHHKIQDLILFPISAFIAMVTEAANEKAIMRNRNYDALELRDLSIKAPLMLSDEDVEVTLQLRPSSQSPAECDRFSIHSWTSNKGWTEHCSGLVTLTEEDYNEIDGDRVSKISAVQLQSFVAEINAAQKEPVDSSKLYESLSELGVAYGSSFAGLSSCEANAECAVANITVVGTDEEIDSGCETGMIIQPAFLEQLIQMYWPILSAKHSCMKTVYLSSSIGYLKLSRKIGKISKIPGQSLRAFCRGRTSVSTSKPAQVSMFATTNDALEALITVVDLTISPIVEGETSLESGEARSLCYRIDWEPSLSLCKVGLGGSTNALEKSADVSKDFEMEAVHVSTENLSELVKKNLCGSGVRVAIIRGSSEAQVTMASMLADELGRLIGEKPEHNILGNSKAEGKVCLFISELEDTLLPTITASEFLNLQQLLPTVQGIFWIVRGAYLQSTNPHANMVTGFARSIRSETLLKFATLDLDSKSILSPQDTIKAIIHVFEAAFGPTAEANCEVEFTERAGSFYVPRFVDDDEINQYVHKHTKGAALKLTRFADRPLQLNTSGTDVIDTLHFVDQSLAKRLSPNDVEIEVKAVGMDSRDSSATTGQDGNFKFGMECSGIVSRIGSDVTDFSIGDRVAALSLHGVYSSFALADYAYRISDQMSFEAASTIPMAYCATYYGLLILGRLVRDEVVLVHNAASAAGQAAIYLAQMTGATVFATVSSVGSKKMLQSIYGLHEDRIFSNQASAFGSAILQSVGTQGVDVVLNCLPVNDNTLRETWKCLSSFARFVDLAKQSPHLTDNGSGLGENTSYISIDLPLIAVRRPKIMTRLMSDISELLDHGKIKPLTSTVFPISEIEEAFLTLQSRKLDGKLLIVPQPENQVKATSSSKHTSLLRADASYILIGGTGGLGRAMTRWMVERGAKTLVLISRTGTLAGTVKILVDDMALLGANVVVRQCNVADRASVDDLIMNGLVGLPEVKGLIHGAMVLRDVLFEKMTHEEYTTVVESKVRGAWNFHHALKSSQLDFFVALSSASAAVGNRGQAAYSAANNFLDAFIQYRSSLGLPSAAIALTVVSDAGYLAENVEAAAEAAKNLSSDTICLAEVLALLEAAIDGRLARTSNNHIITGLRILDPAPFWVNDAKFKHLRLAAEALTLKNGIQGASVSYNMQLKAAQSLEGAEEVVVRGMMSKLAELLMLEEDDMDATKNLSGYALDSLVAIDVRNFITREFEANLQVLELLSSGSIETLAKAICVKSKLVNFE